MRLQVSEEFPEGICGSLQVSYDEQSVDLLFRTAYSQGDSCGVTFLFESREQRKFVSHLIASLLAPRPCTSLALRS